MFSPNVQPEPPKAQSEAIAIAVIRRSDESTVCLMTRVSDEDIQ